MDMDGADILTRRLERNLNGTRQEHYLLRKGNWPLAWTTNTAGTPSKRSIFCRWAGRLTRCVQFVADHVKRTTQVLSIEEALDRFLTTKKKTSDFHSNDLARRLRRWAETRERIQPIYAVTKQEVESYLAQYSAQNFINHRGALPICSATLSKLERRRIIHF
jgi:hypothetical protein